MDETTIVALRDIVNDYPHGVNAHYLRELYESRRIKQHLRPLPNGFVALLQKCECFEVLDDIVYGADSQTSALASTTSTSETNNNVQVPEKKKVSICDSISVTKVQLHDHDDDRAPVPDRSGISSLTAAQLGEQVSQRRPTLCKGRHEIVVTSISADHNTFYAQRYQDVQTFENLCNDIRDSYNDDLHTCDKYIRLHVTSADATEGSTFVARLNDDIWRRVLIIHSDTDEILSGGLIETSSYRANGLSSISEVMHGEEVHPHAHYLVQCIDTGIIYGDVCAEQLFHCAPDVHDLAPLAYNCTLETLVDLPHVGDRCSITVTCTTGNLSTVTHIDNLFTGTFCASRHLHRSTLHPTTLPAPFVDLACRLRNTESARCHYVELNRDIPAPDLLRDILRREGGKPLTPNRPIVIGDELCCRLTDGSYERCVVQAIDGDNYDCMLVDDGYINRVHISQLFEVPDAINGIFREAFAVKVVIARMRVHGNELQKLKVRNIACTMLQSATRLNVHGYSFVDHRNKCNQATIYGDLFINDDTSLTSYLVAKCPKEVQLV